MVRNKLRIVVVGSVDVIIIISSIQQTTAVDIIIESLRANLYPKYIEYTFKYLNPLRFASHNKINFLIEFSTFSHGYSFFVIVLRYNVANT